MSSSHLHHYGRLASAESRSASSLVPVAGRYIRAITDGYQWKGAILRHLDGSGHGGSVQDLPLPRVGRAGDSRLPLQQGPPLVERRQQGPVERLVDERVDLLPLENEDDLVCRKVDGMTVETVLVRVERRAFRDELGRARLGTAFQAGNECELLHDSSLSLRSLVSARCTGTSNAGMRPRSRTSRTTGARPAASSCDQPSAITSACTSSATARICSARRPTRSSSVTLSRPHGQ